MKNSLGTAGDGEHIQLSRRKLASFLGALGGAAGLAAASACASSSGGGEPAAARAAGLTCTSDGGPGAPPVVDWFDARAFGATGNGTTDDTAALQAWLNAATAAGGVAYLPLGHYRCESGNGLAVGSNTVVVGDGRGSILDFAVSNAQSGNFLGGKGVSDIRISSIRITGHGRSTTRTDGCFDASIHFDSSAAIDVDGVEVDGSATIGIYFIACTGCVVTRSRVHDTLADGIAFTLGSTFCRAIGNEIYDTGDDAISATTTATSAGTAPQPTSDVIVEGNDIHDLKTSGTGNGVGICGRRIVVANNAISNTAFCGVHCYGYDEDQTGYVSNAIRVTGNMIDGCGGGGFPAAAGIYFGGARDVVVACNNVRKVGQTTGAGAVVLQNYAKNVLIHGNTIQQVEYDGILVQQVSTKQGEVLAAMCSDYGEPVQLSAGMDCIVVRDNHVSGCTKCSVRVLGEAGRYANVVTVKGNVCYGNGGDGNNEMIVAYVDNFDGAENLIGPPSTGQVHFNPVTSPSAAGVSGWFAT